MSEVIDNNHNNGEKSELKSLKDVQSLEELDFTKIEMIRGETPRDINEKCLQLCKDYLSGNWSQQTVDTIEVRRITGGMANQLYFCGIKEPDTNETVPQEVVIKFYGPNTLGGIENSRIRDVVIALTMSERKLGPKIYGLFEEGQILKFYKNREFKIEEQKVPHIREQVFKALAKIHSMEVPIKKDPNWVAHLFYKSYQDAHEKFPIDKEIEEHNCQLLKNCDLKSEIDWVISVGQKVGSPVVFTHNDFRSSNLLITEPNDELIVCDYDLTAYCYRGYDFVSIAREWGRNQFDWIQTEGKPFDEEEIKPLIEIYVEECVRIQGKSYSENEINSVDNILREVKIFSLFNSMFFVTFFLSNDETGDGFPLSRKVTMEMVENSLKVYFFIKTSLKEEKLIE